MAGSRAEKLGTVFHRVQGLLRTGALKEADKPVWYDVFASFPPRIEPKYERYISERVPVNILYREDAIRAKFYKTFGSPDVIDMRKEDNSSLCQQFIDKYLSLASQSPELASEQLVQSVTDALKAEGITLKTVEEIAKERKAKKKPAVDSSSSGSQVLTDASPISSELSTTDETDMNIDQETDTQIDDYIDEIDSDLKKR